MPFSDKLPPFPMRLNRYLAHCGIGARRQADAYIAQGYVLLNNTVETRMGVQVQESDIVHFKGQQLKLNTHKYLLFNKPKDCITTCSDPQGRKTVFTVLGPVAEGLFPVGRLDRQSTGLLLLTNDGDFAQRLSHPKSQLRKVYTVQLDKAPTPDELTQLQTEGIQLADGLICPDAIHADAADQTSVVITLHSGRNRVIRRLFSAMGYAVCKLDRIAYGPLNKKHLPRGKSRPLLAEELEALHTST